MKAPQRTKKEKAFGKWWCVMFLHSEGWTVTEVFSRQIWALEKMHRDKEVLPDFKYKVVPCTITYQLPHSSKKSRTKEDNK